MSQIMQYTFRLFGPRAGQTININGHPFVDGTFSGILSSASLGSCARVLSFYGAYLRGSNEYDVALAAEEEANGSNEIHTPSAERINDSISSDVRQNGTGPSEESADPSPSIVDPSGADGSSGRSSGDGREHAGVPIFPEDVDKRASEPPSAINEDVKTAVMKLDPDVDSHWVQTGAHAGKPKLQAVEDAYGKAGLTRQDIEAAIPDWNRGKATSLAFAEQG